ncbi:DJ-1-like protein [Basidiobolus meristosporus CBS 931.73]|uniref:D-lactate dehydratase n=1 Tax=Basidiobolus meristosporus CBS 931.73 TaxID=1314790 RepID=A0A1Y1YW20_9FUNG|nr:DJ-1-like protein [Basidiobolus meristosporus CBS 931.73]|eukprot:ORY02230.1 DJ-1-like protein [Basidiobolus meristosporus CBS 931.73]
MAPKSNPKALVLIAEGVEEMETVIIIDVLRRANIEVVVAGVDVRSLPIVCSRGVLLSPDVRFESIKSFDKFDVVIVPGGTGSAKIFSENAAVKALLRSTYDSGKILGSLCAGPLALKAAGIPRNTKLTSHPSIKGQLDSVYDYQEDRVVVCKNLITSRGPGTTFEFALTLVEKLVSKEVAVGIATPMFVKHKL